MLQGLCRRALFQFEIPIHYCSEKLRVDGKIGKWKKKYLVPPLVEMEGDAAIADVYACWNERGLTVAFDVGERSGPLQCDPARWWSGDGVRVCVDTRDTRDIKRATRFCHMYYVLPVGGGTQGKRPVLGLHKMSRAKEPAPEVDLSAVQVGVQVGRRGYSLEVGLPASCLHGWDPDEQGRIGFFYKVRDTSLGDQHLSVDDALGWNSDPSTWATGVLRR